MGNTASVREIYLIYFQHRAGCSLRKAVREGLRCKVLRRRDVLTDYLL